MLRKNSSKGVIAASVISLALCVAMLLGTTFAWWSASTSTLVNTVKSGNLTIDLVNDADASLVGEKLDFVAEDGSAVEDVLWEPGSSYTVQDVYLKNTGTTDIKYKISVIGVSGDEGLAEVIDWTVNGDSTTDFVGTLASGATSGKIALAGKMKETAGNQYMNKTADGIAIAVYATQANATDGFEEVTALISKLDDMPTVTPAGGSAVTLDTAYTFSPIPGAPEDKYADWNADYVVSFNQAVPAGAVTLAGAYDAWNEGAWEAFNNAEEIPEGAEIRLLKDAYDKYVTYDECCNIVKAFNCGAASDVSGLVMTVELRLYERTGGAETGNFVTAGAYTYTF